MSVLQPLIEVLTETDCIVTDLIPDREAPLPEQWRATITQRSRLVPPERLPEWNEYRRELATELSRLRFELSAEPGTTAVAHLWSLAEWRAMFRFDQPTAMPAALLQPTHEHYAALCFAGLKVLARLFRIQKNANDPVFWPSAIYRNPTERLYRDVLRRAGLDCAFAPLEEDIFEKTDLRVKLKDLGRRHGARVQVKDIAEPERIETIRKEYVLADEYVFLTPFNLAAFQLGEESSLDKKIDRARQIQLNMSRAVDRARRRGVNPAELVEEPWVELFANFVRSEALRSTHALRQRESEVGTVRNVTHLQRRQKRIAGSKDVPANSTAEQPTD